MTTRLIQDAETLKSTAHPAQNTNADSASIDLGNVSPGPEMEKVQVRIKVPATPNLANGQTLTYTLQDSADDSTFATIEELEPLVITGAGGEGGPATERTWRLPPAVARYLNANCAASATAGNNTAVSYELALMY